MDASMKKTEPSDDHSARKKSPLRFVFGGCAVFALYRILPGIWVNIMYLLFRTKANISSSKAVSVGIIGGADGPTVVFVTMPVWPVYLFYILLLAVGVWGFFHFGGFSKLKRKCH